MSGWTEQDLADIEAFGKFISEKAQFQLNTTDAVRLVKYMNFMNSARKKIADNILEYRRIMQANQETLDNTLNTSSGE